MKKYEKINKNLIPFLLNTKFWFFNVFFFYFKKLKFYQIEEKKTINF